MFWIKVKLNSFIVDVWDKKCFRIEKKNVIK